MREGGEQDSLCGRAFSSVRYHRCLFEFWRWQSVSISGILARAFPFKLTRVRPPPAEYELYMNVLSELASFLQSPPSRWTRADLERFLKVRAPLLAAHEVGAYGTALGIVTEIVERARDEGVDLTMEGLRRAGGSDDGAKKNRRGNRSGANRTDFLAETLDRLVAKKRPRSHPPSEIPEAARDGDVTDFLAENVRRWRERTGRQHQPPSDDVRSTHPGMEPVSRKSASASSDRNTRPSLAPVSNDTPDQRVTSAHARSESGFDGRDRSRPGTRNSALDSRWHPSGWIELRWEGFLEGEDLRTSLAQLIRDLRARDGDAILADMRQASVLSEADADWFNEWLQQSGGQGLRRFAIINPVHVISRMQLNRLREVAGASAVRLPGISNVEIAFFDAVDEARAWLSR